MNYASQFVDESQELKTDLKKLVSSHGNDENYKLKANVSLNLT